MSKRTRAFSRTAIEAAGLLGAQIAAARLERRWTTGELAERAGISRPTLARVERGDPTVGLGVALDVAALAGVPLFFTDPSRLGDELSRQRQVVRLLPQAPRGGRSDDVDDDF